MFAICLKSERSASPRAQSWSSAIAWVIGLAVSYLLLLSAIAHLNNPYVFLASVYEYRLVPRIGTEVLAMLLPFLHITIALCLIAGHRPSTMFTAASALFATYA